jgi:hypothetical protein
MLHIEIQERYSKLVISNSSAPLIAWVDNIQIKSAVLTTDKNHKGTNKIQKTFSFLAN